MKSKVAFNLTKRQLICFGTAALIGVPLFFVLRDSGGNTAPTLGMMAVMLPAFFLGMYEKNGQPMEKLLSYYVQSRFLRPKIRPYKTNNYYTAEKEAAAQAEQDRLKAEEEAKKAAEEAEKAADAPKENKVTKYAATFLGAIALIALAAGGGFYAFAKQKQKKQAEKEALDPDANYTEDKGDFEIPTEDELEDTGEEDTEPI